MAGSSTYHHGDLYATLVKTALDLIEEKGAGSLSLREVARTAGVSHGAPAHHFKDKSGLLTAIATQGFGLLAAALESAMQSPSDQPISILREAGVAYVRFAAENSAYFEVMFRPELLDKNNEAFIQAGLKAHEMLKTSAENVLAKSDLKVSTEALTLKAWAIAHGLAQLWLSGNLGPTAEAGALEAALKAVFDDDGVFYK